MLAYGYPPLWLYALHFYGALSIAFNVTTTTLNSKNELKYFFAFILAFLVSIKLWQHHKVSKSL